MNEHDREQQQVVCSCKSCGDPITRYYYVGYPYCYKCRSEYRRQKYDRIHQARPHPERTTDFQCPFKVSGFSFNIYYCSKYGNGKFYCSTVRQKGKCEKEA